MNMNVNAANDPSFVEQARRDLKKIENKGVSKAETLEDLRNTKGKSFKTADLEKLMQKYDPDAYEKYEKIAFTSEGGHTQSGMTFMSRWIDGVKAGFAKDVAKGANGKTATDKNAAKNGVVYEQGKEADKKPTYSINKMSAEDRAALVKQLKNDLAVRKSQLADIVNQMLSKQAGKSKLAGISKLAEIFSPENLKKVSEEDIKKAQEDISEDGYWGVKQTSQRLFDFASALAGDDVDKMKEMQSAMEKGFKKATKAWGQELPGICSDTISAANKLFEDYYASKKAAEE